MNQLFGLQHRRTVPKFLIYVNQRLPIKNLQERARVKEFLSTKRIGLINFEMN